MKCHTFVIHIVLLSVLMFQTTTVIGEAKSEQAIWGELAAKQTKEAYPEYRLVDYAYKGKSSLTDIREQFHYMISMEKGNEQEHINVYVLSNPQTREPVDVFFDEIR